MKNIYTIEEAAKYFGLPKSTLLYWEKEGLIHFDRMQENQYRLVTADTVFQIENVLSLRDLDISIKKIRTAHLMTLEERYALYEEAVDRARQKIRALEKMRRSAEKQLEQIREIPFLREHPYCSAVPDFERLAAHSQSTVAAECAETGRFAILMKDPESREFTEAFISDGEERREILWRRPDGVQWRAFLLDIAAEGKAHKLDGLSGHLDALHEMGLRTGALAARYLSEGVEDGRLHIYFKAYVEITGAAGSLPF